MSPLCVCGCMFANCVCVRAQPESPWARLIPKMREGQRKLEKIIHSDRKKSLHQSHLTSDSVSGSRNTALSHHKAKCYYIPATSC